MRVRLDEVHLENQMMQDIYECMLTDEDRENGVTWEDKRREDEVETALERWHDNGSYDDPSDYYEDVDGYAANFFDVVSDVGDSCDELGLDPILFVENTEDWRLLVRDKDGWFKTVRLVWESGSPQTYWEPGEPAYWELHEECYDGFYDD